MKQAVNAIKLGPRARAIVRAAARLINPLILLIAGRRWMPILGVLRHRGRVSGRMYATPLGKLNFTFRPDKGAPVRGEVLLCRPCTHGVLPRRLLRAAGVADGQLAPEVFADSGQASYVRIQPSGQEEIRRASRALLACPTHSICIR